MSSGFGPALCDARTEERAVDGDTDKRDDFRLQSSDEARELCAASDELRSRELGRGTRRPRAQMLRHGGGKARGRCPARAIPLTDLERILHRPDEPRVDGAPLCLGALGFARFPRALKSPQDRVALRHQTEHAP